MTLIIDPLQLPCHFRKTQRYFVQVRILRVAILEYMGIGKMHWQALYRVFVVQSLPLENDRYRCEKQHLKHSNIATVISDALFILVQSK